VMMGARLAGLSQHTRARRPNLLIRMLFKIPAPSRRCSKWVEAVSPRSPRGQFLTPLPWPQACFCPALGASSFWRETIARKLGPNRPVSVHPASPPIVAATSVLPAPIRFIGYIARDRVLVRVRQQLQLSQRHDLLFGRVVLPGCPPDVAHERLGRRRRGVGFLSHLRSLRATMSQKSSVPQAVSFVLQALKRDTKATKIPHPGFETGEEQHIFPSASFPRWRAANEA
jgi:hypothetical protein